MPTHDLAAILDRRDPLALSALVRELVDENAVLRQENERLAAGCGGWRDGERPAVFVEPAPDTPDWIRATLWDWPISGDDGALP